jgi:inhibitor of cysteine peptidase
MPQVDESYDGKEVEVTIGQTLEVQLNENPTAGFRWNLTSKGEPQCLLLDDSYDVSSTTPGQGGIHSWRFRAEENGECQIKFAYGRQWQQDAKPAQTFTLKVRITGSI